MNESSPVGNPAAGSPPERTLNSGRRNIWSAVRARKWIVVSTVLLISAVAWVGEAFSPGSYVSSIKVQPSPDWAFECSEPLSPQKRQELAYIEYTPLFDSQLALLNSKENLESVIRHLKLDEIFGRREGVVSLSMEAAIKSLSQRMNTVRDPSLPLGLIVTVTDSDRLLAEAIANQVADDFAELKISIRRNKQAAGLASLKSQLARAETEVLASQRKLDSIRLEFGLPK